MPANGNSLKPVELISNIYAATGSQTVTAKLAGISQSAVSDIVSGHSPDLAIAKKSMAGKYLLASESLLETAFSDKVRPVSTQMEAVTASAICADKAAKLTEVTGNPLVAIQVNTLSDALGAWLSTQREPLHIVDAEVSSEVDTQQPTESPTIPAKSN